MNGAKQILTFPCQAEFSMAKACVDRLALDYAIILPFPACSRVGVDSRVRNQTVNVNPN